MTHTRIKRVTDESHIILACYLETVQTANATINPDIRYDFYNPSFTASINDAINLVKKIIGCSNAIKMGERRNAEKSIKKGAEPNDRPA
jgi:hypothetical protein